MFMKLLLTLLVIAGAIGALRLRKRQPRRPVKSDINENHLPAGKSALPRIAAYGALGVMLLGCAVFIYLQLQDAWQVVTVRIIDAGSGKESTYQAYKGDVSGRSFTTTDGRRVNLAEVERMELGGR
ncbi:MAG: hypothetical protein KDI43_10075 [Gammaproteobacteria bacterium]|nr:hypothetical protein [Gammaproteobacteria bacterium]MCP5407739.1 hypothetical protein [Chromatiaceae bacterium]MCP5441647.1 hypothetical protein [Chromatiaceae bacterium]